MNNSDLNFIFEYVEKVGVTDEEKIKELKKQLRYLYFELFVRFVVMLASAGMIIIAIWMAKSLIYK